METKTGTEMETSTAEQSTSTIAKKAQTLTPYAYADCQPGVHTQGFEGEDAMVKDNVFTGWFHLDGVPPMPRGGPQSEITF